MASSTLTMKGIGRRFNRGSWLTLGVVLFIAVASVVLSVLRLASVGDGCVFDDGTSGTLVFGDCIGDWATPLRPRDELLNIVGVEIAGGDIAAWRQEPPAGWVDGGVARYMVRRDGQDLVLDVPLRRLGTDDIARAFGYGFRRQGLDWNTPVFLGALVIFLLAPQTLAAQLLFVAIGGLTAVTTLLWPSDNVALTFAPAGLWYVGGFFEGVWLWLFVPTLLLLVLSFPRRVSLLAQRPRLAALVIYGVAVAVDVAALVTNSDVLAVAGLGGGALLVAGTLLVLTTRTFLRERDAVIRAQTAWLALGLTLGLAFWPLIYVLMLLFPGLEPAINRLPGWLNFTLSALPTLAFPVCLGIAITRYRLFDIEVIIRRTLVYSTLTLLLALVYFGGVILLQSLFEALTGQSSPLAIIASTLAIAALFNPLRRRVQDFIDRRFYRRKYDAERILAAFGATLRDEVDQDRLTDALLDVVEQTMRPASVSLWLRDVDSPAKTPTQTGA